MLRSKELVALVGVIAVAAAALTWILRPSQYELATRVLAGDSTTVDVAILPEGTRPDTREETVLVQTPRVPVAERLTSTDPMDPTLSAPVKEADVRTWHRGYVRNHLADSVFASEYSTWDDKEINKEKDRVFRELGDTQQEAFQAMYDGGAFEVLERDAEGNPIFNGVGELLYSTRVTGERPGEVQLVVLPVLEFQSVYDTSDRWAWLARDERKRSRK